MRGRQRGMLAWGSISLGKTSEEPRCHTTPQKGKPNVLIVFHAVNGISFYRPKYFRGWRAPFALTYELGQH
jgi:hypothetical protein